MNENVLSDITRNLLGAGYLDLKFLVDLLDEHNIDFDDIMDSVECNFGKEFITEINYLVYETLYQVANKFIESNVELFEYESNEFEIYTNCLDSHIYFNSEIIQAEFEKSY